MRAAKRAARSELSVSKGEWQRSGYAQSDLLSTAGVVDQVERVHCSVRRPGSPMSMLQNLVREEEHNKGLFAYKQDVSL